MKKLLAFALFVTAGFASQAATSTYFVDDSKIESVLEASETVSLNSADLQLDQSILKANGDDQIVAVVLGFFLGGLAIHRVYLGGRFALVPIYFFTCGGIFGIVPLVDWISILLNGTGDFVGNDKFIVWAG